MAPSARKSSGVSDHRIQPGGIKREGSWRKTAERNLDIIELAKKITAENRPATKDEQQLLAKYTGFGASEIANSLFPGYAEYGHINEYRVKPEWKELVTRVKEIFTPEELKTAARSTQYAHYTSEAVINSIYKALGRFGFKGGKVLEPGAGIGHFWGLMPDNMVGDSRYTSIEMDHLTATIAKLLYPNQDILQADFTKQALPGNFFDLGIGNPPFASTVITSDPAYKKNRFFLHDYFFAKTIDKVRPGGLLVFVTSKGTMDKADSKARAYLDERADLLGAIRLPQTAFMQNAGTEVVTDVIFMRKRLATDTKGATAWLGLKEVTTPEGPTMINEYFAGHPEMILGTNSLKGSMYGANEYTVLPLEGNIEEHFAQAVEKLPAAIYSTESTIIDETVKEVIERDFNPKNKKEGGLYVSDSGEIMEVENGAGRAFSERFPKMTAKDKAWLADYIGLRDAIKQAQYDQLHDLNWEKSLKALNKTHEAFIKKHGYVLEHTVSERVKIDEEGAEISSISKRYKNRLYREDAESPLITGIEKELDGGLVGKGPFLSGRSIQRPVRQKPTSIGDSMALVLDETGTLNLGLIAEKMEMSRDEAIEALGDQIYLNHATGIWETRDEYLSGDVVGKLAEAEVAAKSDDKYRRNVEGLREAQPAPLAAKDISVALGAPWVDAKIIQEFANDVLDAGVRVAYNPAHNSWSVENAIGGRGKQSARRQTTDWGTADRGPNEILEAVLNNRSLKITHLTQDKKTVVDTTATAAVNDLAKKMRAKFSSWVWEDAGRAGTLLTEYNRRYNNLAPRAFNGDHLTLPGVSIKFKLHSHQKRAIWRAIQAGNTYLAHAVGSGKTIEMIAAGMEMKRLGLIQKPMYVVPKHMLQQFANEFLELYPLANLMVADEENFHTDNRKRFMAQAALNAPDAVIVTHPSLGKVGVTEESVAPVRESMIDDLRASLADLEDDKTGNRILIKKAEKRIEQLEQMFDSMLAGTKDRAITFEEMGVDFMFVDEAHEFRKLDFVTNRQAKGIDSNGSRKAIDLYIKTKALEARRPGRSHIFASGTPVTNTMGELYTLMRFFDERQMEADGIHHFDAWASMFGEISAGFERNAAGNYETVERFSTFVNVPELMKRVRTFMDVLTSSDLGATVKRPDIEGGHPQMVIAPQSDEMKAYMKNVLQPRIEASKKWKPSKDQPGNPDPIINIITDGRLASIDMRFVQGTTNDPTSKLNVMIDGIIDTYKKNKGNTYLDPATGRKSTIKGAAQIVFYNNGFGDGVKKRRGFDARAWMMKRLSQAMIPTSHIAWIDDYATAAKKEQLFKKVRSGEVRILIGSAKKMGTGMNVQNRLQTLHYLDPPWYPSDVEQPLGRIIRQGNQHDEVNVNWYATEGSYDSTMWQMVARKSKFIEQALSGDNSVRKMEDTSEVSSYEMASALASGDVRVIQLAGLKADIERYERLRQAHFSDQHSLKAKLSNTRHDIKTWDKRLQDYAEAIKAVGGYQKEVTGAVGKKTFDKRAELGEALSVNLAKLITAGNEGTFEVGKVNGFTVVVQIKPIGSRVHVVVTKEIKPDIEVGYGDNSGLATKVVNQLNGLDSKKRELSRRVEEANIELRKIEKRLGAPFEYGAELHGKIAEAAALENELVAEGQATEEEAAQAEEPVAKDQLTPDEDNLSVLDAATNAPSASEIPTITNAYQLLTSAIKNGDPATAGLARLLRQSVSGKKLLAVPVSFGDIAHSSYSPSKGITIALKDRQAYHTGLHEAIHAITVKEMKTNPVLRTQVRAMMKQVAGKVDARLLTLAEKSEGSSRKFLSLIDGETLTDGDKAIAYALSSPEEFLAQAFSSKSFQELLKTIPAIRQDGFIKTLWDRLIALVGKALGITDRNMLTDVIAKVVEIGQVEVNGGGKGRARLSVETDQTETAAFKKWFGDSKIVDNNGNPRVLYHGSKEGYIRKFNPKKSVRPTGMMFFATNPESAEFFITETAIPDGNKGNTPAIYPVYLKIDKLFEGNKHAEEIEGFVDANFAAIKGDLKSDEDTIGNDAYYGVETASEYMDGIISENWEYIEGSPTVINHLRSLGYDGVKIIEAAETNYAVFSPNQIKSAIGNNGDFATDNDDIRFSIDTPEQTAANNAFSSVASIEPVARTMGSIRVKAKSKTDSTFLDRVLSTPEYYFRKFAASGRVLLAALNRRDVRFEKETEILNGRDKDGNVNEKGFVEYIRDLRKRFAKAYKDANDYLLDSDRESHGFGIKELDDGLWQVNGPDGKTVSEHAEESGAVAGMIAAESEYLQELGYSPEAIMAVKMARELTNRGFDVMAADMRRIIQEAKAAGLPNPLLGDGKLDEAGRYGVYAQGKGKPVALFATEQEADDFLDQAAQMISYTVISKDGKSRDFMSEIRANKWARQHSGTVNGNKTFSNLTVRQRTDTEMRPLTVKQALAQMGDLRGTYFPRQRDAGSFVLIARKDGMNPIRKNFDLPMAGTDTATTSDKQTFLQKAINAGTPMGREATRLTRLGYDVTMDRDESPVDDVFAATNLITSIDSLLQDSMATIDKNDDADVKAGQQINKLLTMEIADIFKARGYLSSRMKRLDGDETWVGYEEDMGKALTQYGKGIAAGTAKRETSRAMILAFTGRDFSWEDYKQEVDNPSWPEYQAIVEERRIDPGKQKNLYVDVRSYMVDILRNEEQVDRIMGTLKGLAVLKFLGFRVSSAAVNATNMVMGVPATMSGRLGISLMKANLHVTRAATDYGKYRSGIGALSKEDREIFQEITARGWDDAQFNQEAARELRSEAGEAWNKVMTTAMYMFGAVERANRAMTIYAAYKATAEKNPTMAKDQLWEKAKTVSDRAHGVYGKETAPAWTRGKFNPLRLPYTFSKFSHNYMLNAWDMGVTRGEYKAAAYLLLSPAIMSGAGASIVGPLAFALVGAAGGGDDPEEDFYAWAEDTFGSETFARHGLGGLAGINLKGSLSVNNPIPTKMSELAGAPGAIIGDTIKAGEHFSKGELGKGLERLLPTGIGSMGKAYREATEGVTTGGYGQVFYGNEPLKADNMDAFLRFFSFNPSRLSGIREKQWNEKQVAAKYQERRSEINNRIKHDYLQGKGITPEMRKEILRYNEMVKGSGRSDIKPMTYRSINIMLRRSNRASKFERGREM